MNYIFSPIIPKSSVKFLLTKNLRSLVQAYPSINHWWSITFATLPYIERVQPILLNTRTRYTVATNWYTFTHIYIWSSTSREMPESIIKCACSRNSSTFSLLMNNSVYIILFFFFFIAQRRWLLNSSLLTIFSWKSEHPAVTWPWLALSFAIARCLIGGRPRFRLWKG